MRSILFISLAINLLFLTSIVVARVDGSRAGVGTGSQIDISASATASNARRGGDASLSGSAATSVLDYYSALRSRGLIHEETLMPVAGWVLRALATFQEGESSYWLDDVGIRRAALRERTGAEATIRASVRALFGEAATAKPEFRNLFYPLGENFNFLDSDQQLAVRDWERERSLAARSDQRHPAEERPCAASPASPATHCANAAAPPGVRADLPDFLSAELQFEYSLRRSPLAARLRAAGLDEQSFRAAYRLLNAVVSGSGARDQLRAREQLQSMIGLDRTDRLLMPFDPAFQSIAGILEQAGVARSRLLVVYSIVARANETVLDILTSDPAGPDATATSREIARIKRNERMQLEELLSSEVVARILSARQRIGAIDDPAAFCRAAA